MENQYHDPILTFDAAGRGEDTCSTAKSNTGGRHKGAGDGGGFC